MGNADAIHFSAYREQTRIKHEILKAYLPTYLRILGSRHQQLIYFDAFAGRGSYKDGTAEFPGSPIQAIHRIGSDPSLANRVLLRFLERREDHFTELRDSVAQAASKYSDLQSPIVANGDFASYTDHLLNELRCLPQPPPIFLFADPCGVEGASFHAIAKILRRPKCEALIFFNYEGLNRIIGNAQKVGGSQTLDQFYGSRQDALHVIDRVRAAANTQEREAIIVGEYEGLLKRHANTNYICWFRIERSDRTSTSHYLIHATKHPKGYGIMKGVMWSQTMGSGSIEGRLELLQATDGSDGLFGRTDIVEQEDAILKTLETGIQRVKLFCETWPEQPGNRFPEAFYRRRLLKLEQLGRVEVLHEDGTTPFPAHKRLQRDGQPTIAGRLYVRIKR